MHSGPPDKWTSFAVAGQSSFEVLAKLNDLAKAGYDTVAVAAPCADGWFVFVGGYSGSAQ